jgi:dihydrofolate reductase
MIFNAIAAISRNKGIGLNNQLPWNLKEDLIRFKKLTTGNGNNSVIMGKNTWNSIKFLNNRHNYIISSTLKIDEKKGKYEIKSFESIDSLIAYLNTKNYDINWVIGGSIIYKTFFDRNIINKLHITLIDKDIHCDTFIPTIPKYFIKSEFRLCNEVFEEKYRVLYVIYIHLQKNQQLIYKNMHKCTVKDIHYDDLPNIYVTISMNNKEIQTPSENLRVTNSKYI